MGVEEVKFFKSGDVIPDFLIDPIFNNKLIYRNVYRFLIDVILIKNRGFYNQEQYSLRPLYKKINSLNEICINFENIRTFRCIAIRIPPSLKELIQYT